LEKEMVKLWGRWWKTSPGGQIISIRLGTDAWNGNRRRGTKFPGGHVF
jgi:hypothetical protein